MTTAAPNGLKKSTQGHRK